MYQGSFAGIAALDGLVQCSQTVGHALPVGRGHMSGGAQDVDTDGRILPTGINTFFSLILLEEFWSHRYHTDIT